MIQIFSYKTKLRRVLHPHLPIVMGTSYVQERRKRFEDSISYLLPDKNFPDAIAKARGAKILVNTFLGVFNSFIETEPSFYKDQELHLELTKLIKNYLMAP